MSDQDDTAAQLMTVMENLAPVREAILGYRASLIADGFSVGAAEQMTVAFHAWFMTSLTQSAAK